MKRRLVWGLVTALAAVVLGGLGLLSMLLRPYWVAKYHGEQIDLTGAVLVYAPLRNAGLHRVRLADANLSGADLRRACLNYVTLDRALLSGASLRGATVWRCSLRGADLRGADLTGAQIEASILTRARYDTHTRWPNGFDPRRHGAVQTQ